MSNTISCDAVLVKHWYDCQRMSVDAATSTVLLLGSAKKCSCVEAERYAVSCANLAQMGYSLAPAAAVCRVRSPTLEKLTD